MQDPILKNEKHELTTESGQVKNVRVPPNMASNKLQDNLKNPNVQKRWHEIEGK